MEAQTKAIINCNGQYRFMAKNHPAIPNCMAAKMLAKAIAAPILVRLPTSPAGVLELSRCPVRKTKSCRMELTLPILLECRWDQYGEPLAHRMSLAHLLN